MNEKSVLFNTEMVRAILDGRKTVTRRVVKPQPVYRIVSSDENRCVFVRECAPYHPGDVLWVRETWREYNGKYYYKAKLDYPPELQEIEARQLKLSGLGWRPSIHMPREAARIFLRVEDVHLERLQDIDVHGVTAEGVRCRSGRTDGVVSLAECREAFRDVWDGMVKKSDIPRYGWEANPWVWVISFDKIEMEE